MANLGGCSTVFCGRSPVSPYAAVISAASCFLSAVHGRIKRVVELSASDVRLAHQLGLGLQLSKLLLQVISSQSRQRLAPAGYQFAFKVHLGLPMPGGAPLANPQML